MNWKEQFDDLESRGRLFNGTDCISRVEAKNLASEIIEKLIADIPMLHSAPNNEFLKQQLKDKWL